MMPNPDFVRVMQDAFAPDATLLVGCQVGGRSMRAAQVLESFGFTDVVERARRLRRHRDPMGARSTGLGAVGACRSDRAAARAAVSRRCSPSADSTHVIARFFNAWEQRLATVDTNRVVRPFEWGLDWLGLDRRTSPDPRRAITAWSRDAMARHRSLLCRRAGGRRSSARDDQSCAFRARCVDARRRQQHGRRPRSFRRSRSPGRPTRAPSSCCRSGTPTPAGHVGLCQLFARFGITRAAPEPAVPRRAHGPPSSSAPTTSSARTSAARCRRIARPCSTRGATVDWLVRAGLRAHRHHRHEPRLVPVDADDGARPAHPRGRVQSRLAVLRRRRLARPLDAPRARRPRRARHARRAARVWMPISPWPFIERVRGRSVLLVYARYDLTFPVDLSRQFRRASSIAAACRTISACCRAATTRPARRRSSFSTGTT